MSMKKKKEGIGFMPLAIGALLLSLLLVLFMDASRLLTPQSDGWMQAKILLEDMDAATVEALRSETALSIDGTVPSAILRIDEIRPQPIREITRDGRILTLPSTRRFCAQVTLSVQGTRTEDGFLAGGSHRLLAGSHLQAEGKRMVASGLLVSIALPTEEAEQ